LRKQLEGWRGKAFSDDEAAQFDISKLLGKSCMLSVVETEKGGKTYSNIASIGKLPKGIPEPIAENPLLYFAPDDESQFEELPSWLREKISNAIVETKRPEQHTEHFEDSDLQF
jgi:hypothetical protein